jgi:hypothetical protein
MVRTVLKHDVSETALCLRFQVKPAMLGPIDTASLYFRILAARPNVVGFT